MYHKPLIPRFLFQGVGWTEEALDRSCIALPWFLYSGAILIYSGLFTKLWRVHKVLQFSRRRVPIRHLVKPMIGIFVATCGLLAAWTAVDPLLWEREESNSSSNQSVGFCRSNSAAFAVPVFVLGCVPTVMTCIMAYKTRDVDASLAESFWIFTMILVQLEAIVIATPVVIILKDQATGGVRYGVLVLMISILPLSTLSFLMIPKVIAHRKSLAAKERSQVTKTDSPAVTGTSEEKANEKDFLANGHANGQPEHSQHGEEAEQLAVVGTSEEKAKEPNMLAMETNVHSNGYTEYSQHGEVAEQLAMVSTSEENAEELDMLAAEPNVHSNGYTEHSQHGEVADQLAMVGTSEEKATEPDMLAIDTNVHSNGYTEHGQNDESLAALDSTDEIREVPTHFQQGEESTTLDASGEIVDGPGDSQYDEEVSAPPSETDQITGPLEHSQHGEVSTPVEAVQIVDQPMQSPLLCATEEMHVKSDSK